MRVPLRLQAKAVTGVGDVAGAILANVRIEGMLAITPKLVRGDNLALQSDKLKGKVSLLIDLKTGKFDIVISGGMTRYLIPGLGIVDVGAGASVLVDRLLDMPGYRITEVHGEVFGLTVRSRHVGAQIGAAFKAIGGGELRGLTKQFQESREEAIAYMDKLGEERKAALKPGPAPSGSVDYGDYR